MHHKVLAYISVILLSASSLFATGPSYMQALIHPISINQDGYILCRTKFMQNPMGGYNYQDYEYGFCVIGPDSIVYEEAQVVKYDFYNDDEIYMNHIAYWDSIFNSDFDNKHLSGIERQLNYRYDFHEANAHKYKRNDTIPIKQFIYSNTFHDSIAQYSLHGATGRFYEGQELVEVSYDFGHIIFIMNRQNSSNYDGHSPYIGAKFSYAFNIAGSAEYEDYYITGIIFRKKKS